MSDHASEIDVSGATEALEARLTEGSRTAVEDAAPNTQEEGAAPALVEEAEGSGEPAAQEAEVLDFTHIPDEALTPEMLAVKRSLQADYTRKAQEAAPWRKLADEFEVESPDELRAALEAYQQLSDPSNWPTLQRELTEYLVAQGHDPAQAAEVAADQIDQHGRVALDEFDSYDDEDSVPAALQTRLDQLEQQNRALAAKFQAQEVGRQQEAHFAQVAQKLTAQENTVRSTHPDWNDQDIEAAYDLMGDNDDLMVGVARLESIQGAAAGRYLTTKESAKRAPGPVAGAGVISQEEQEAPHTIEEAHERALEYVRRTDREAAGA